jgi:hypothetical protein
MLAEDQISVFLKMTPKDCKNSKLLITKVNIEGDRSRLPTLIGNVIPHLTMSVETKEFGASATKGTIANTSSASPTSVIEPRGLPEDMPLRSATL